jgi:hypothetical protein
MYLLILVTHTNGQSSCFKTHTHEFCSRRISGCEMA